MRDRQTARLALYMMTSSNGIIFRVPGPLCGEFTGHRWIPLTKPVTRSVDVFFNLRLNKRLSKQSWGWWFETPSRLFWRHCNVSCPVEGRSWQRTCRRFRIALYLNAQIQVLLHVCVKHVSGSRYVINYLDWVLVGIFINTLNIR